MALLGTAYITATQFREHLFGLDLTGIVDADLTDYIRQASRLADNFIHGTFDVATRNERQVWTDARRFYPQVLPVHAARLLRLHIGGGQTADINPPDLFPNNQGGYIEVVSLATAVGLSAELVSLGLTQVVAEFTYKTGGGFRGGTPDGIDFTNLTTLAAALNNTATAFDVMAAAGLAVDDIIRVDTEYMWITAIAGVTLTVVRAAQMNQVAAAHLAGANVARLILDLPEELELAIAIITAALIAARRDNEEGVTGVRSFMIGSYSVTYGRGSGQSGYPFIPDQAQMILEPYRNVALR